MMKSTGIGIVGCGYVADSYRYCLDLHDDRLRLLGVYDRDAARLEAFRACWNDRAYGSLEALLADDAIRIVLNLTDPENHADVTRAAIAAGKHVYSEKPLAMTHGEADALRAMAMDAGVRLSSAPCNLLSESAQTAMRAVRAGQLGTVRLVYAELDDGLIHRANYATWLSRSGRAWPARGEFHTGCTFEHAGYALTILCAMFGPVRAVTSFAKVLVPDKRTTPPLSTSAPDFSVGLLEFDGGIVARLTNSIVAPYDHRLRIVGDDGHLEISELWDYGSPVILRQAAQTRLARYVERRFPGWRGSRLSLGRKPNVRGGRGRPTMDFMRGVVELADAIDAERPSRLSEDFGVHITEVTEMLQHPERFASPAQVQSSFAPIAPVDWAR